MQLVFTKMRRCGASRRAAPVAVAPRSAMRPATTSALRFPAARVRSYSTKPANPQVFFDISIKQVPKGRITFEVQCADIYIHHLPT